MTQLSRLTKLGIAPEVTPGTYVVPSYSIPFTKADFDDVIGSIKDESYRYNDSELQGMYQGPVHATWSLDVMAYPDLVGLFLAGIVGPDVVTPGVSTTLAAAAAAGATSIQTAVSIPAGSTIMLDTGQNIEYAVTGAATGTGPYEIPIVTPVGGLSKSHLINAAVVGQTTHTFKQNPFVPRRSYAITLDDTTGNPQGYTYATLSDFGLKIDPKNAVTMSVKLTSMPATSQATFAPAFNGQPPLLGWQWAMANAGSASTRGLSLDYTIKRSVDPIQSSDGTQGPREIFQGPLSVDGSYKAIFENQLDYDLYRNNVQLPATATLTQPITAGGTSLAITTSKTGFEKASRDIGGNYVQASYSISGIYNGVDGGSLAVVLKNFHPGVY
ncbi:Hypothetical protein AJAP_42405 (plasmid) [Amycolatopsis japonica]|uniref:Uncharacterized protein n=1 Tax=Amycolatopsis japonica TaxID=208439 RepID=A0A075V4F4_9PSEU|nr:MULTISPECIES: phage tail tube protein [Amycolatopsis]AIG81252.1 Hypothetical protein AJAP_42405 [Amycolatopsis japonica]RSN38565.1 hypothetical protein DMC64_41595 [Amycolatopsis sp. WAC 04197]